MTYVLTEDDIAVGDEVSTQLQKMWGWYLLGGVISMIFGFLVISWRHPTVFVVIYFASAFFIVGGVFEIIGSVRMARQRWLHLLFGLFWVGAVIVGWSFLVLGIFDIISSLRFHHQPYWWAYLLRGLIAVALGFLCIRHPGAPLTALVVLIGIMAIVFGAVEVVGALVARHATKNWEKYKTKLR